MPIFDTTRLQSKLSFHTALKSIIAKYGDEKSKPGSSLSVVEERAEGEEEEDKSDQDRRGKK